VSGGPVRRGCEGRLALALRSPLQARHDEAVVPDQADRATGDGAAMGKTRVMGGQEADELWRRRRLSSEDGLSLTVAGGRRRHITATPAGLLWTDGSSRDHEQVAPARRRSLGSRRGLL
jgi:hypothetical protein